ncbi:transcriptional repressor LexA [Candidatus Uhrbacteria bacterium]|jgi:repressor LexA|nr:transcriptional repressor LexA [Candidatus Uhrbacteria bacterium]MBT7717253.1 transcriptional repressor LexA [Candidatus Uhrbacteria bacterium]
MTPLPPLTKKQREVLDYIESFVQDNGYTPSYREIAKGMGLSSPSTVYQHIQALCEKGVINTAEDGSARSIELVEDEVSTMSIMLPMAGVITAGEPIEAVEDNEAFAVPTDFVVDIENSYVLRVKGRSMIEDGIFDGDYVVIERNPSPKNGDVVVALLDNQYATLKRFFREAKHIRLQPANSTMDPIIVKGDVNIQGIVRAVMRKFHN